ncbi:MAG: hypothetical protein DRQ44_10795 [Gammaproteobacteria bacterium]|nr:MAG: hypothetical protein DRQ44_10795 [Gammaproteobacteria bacterium]
MSACAELPAGELHLIVPGLCGPLAETQSVKNSPVLKKWINTLSRAGSCSSPANINDVLVSIFNLKIKTDFPSAALTLLANDMYDASRFYMHADPVHLRADMDHAVLTSSEDLNISSNESKVLCETLNQHFNQDGLRFVALQNDQWFVLAEKEIHLDTTPLVAAVGRNINFILPEGEHATHWKKLLTEAQMLMFSHDVNVTRENNGYMSINSLWFHGSGELPVMMTEAMPVAKADEHGSTLAEKCRSGIGSDVSSVCSNQDMLKGLAKLVNSDYLTVPDTADEYARQLLAYKKNAIHLLHLGEIEHLVNYTDVSLWLDKLTELLEHWIYPLLKVANKNNINVILYPCNKKQYHFSKYDFLKFWQQGKLEQHVNSY